MSAQFEHSIRNSSALEPLFAYFLEIDLVYHIMFRKLITKITYIVRGKQKKMIRS